MQISATRTLSHDIIGKHAGLNLTIHGLTVQPDGSYLHSNLPGMKLRRLRTGEKAYGVKTLAAIWTTGHISVLGGRPLQEALENGRIHVPCSPPADTVGVDVTYEQPRLYGLTGSWSSYKEKWRTTTLYRDALRPWRNGLDIFPASGAWEAFEVYTAASGVFLTNGLSVAGSNDDGWGRLYRNADEGGYRPHLYIPGTANTGVPVAGLVCVSAHLGSSKSFFARAEVKAAMLRDYPDADGVKAYATSAYDRIVSNLPGDVALGIYLRDPNQAFLLNPTSVNSQTDIEKFVRVWESDTKTAESDQAYADMTNDPNFFDRSVSKYCGNAWRTPGVRENGMWYLYENVAAQVNVNGRRIGPYSWARIVRSAFPEHHTSEEGTPFRESDFMGHWDRKMGTNTINARMQVGEAAARNADLVRNTYGQMAADGLGDDNYLWAVDTVHGLLYDAVAEHFGA